MMWAAYREQQLGIEEETVVETKLDEALKTSLRAEQREAR